MPILYWVIAGIIALGSGTAVAANVSVPGDPLYGMDQAMEKFQEQYMLWSESVELDFYEDQTEERLDELEALEADIPEDEENAEEGDETEEGEDGTEDEAGDGSKVPGESALKAIELWEQHHARAMERLQESVDKVHLLRAGLENDLGDAETEREQERIQKRIDQLDGVEAQRTQRLERTEGRDTLPGAPAILRHIEKMQEWKDLSDDEQEGLQEEAEELEDEDEEENEDDADEEETDTANNTNPNGKTKGWAK